MIKSQKKGPKPQQTNQQEPTDRPTDAPTEADPTTRARPPLETNRELKPANAAQ